MKAQGRSVSEDAMLDKIHGCLVGLAVGDAIAMPGLFTHQQTLAAYGGEITGFIDASSDVDVDPVHYLLPAGTVTDDTHAAVAIVKYLILSRKISPEVFAKAYVEWVDVTDELCARLGRNRGFAGPNTLIAINQLRAGESPYKTGLAGTTGGAAMRVAPIGFLFPGRIEETVDAVEASCIPTHNTTSAISGASAVACAVSAIAKGAVAIEEIIDSAIEAANQGMKRGNDKIYAASVARRIKMACDIALSGRPWPEIRQDLYDLVGTGMPSHEVVPAALALFARAKGDLKTAVLSAANTGGDCDTLGSISGTLCGALQGAGAIPVEFHQTIERVNGLNLPSLAAKYHQALNETWRVSSDAEVSPS